MFVRCEKRGSQAAGAFNQEGDFIKAGVKASDLAMTSAYLGFLERSVGCKYIVGHCRQSTRGDPSILANDHPVFNKRKNIFLVHNGTVTCKELDKNASRTDTWIFMHGINQFLQKDRSCDYLSRAVRDSFTWICDHGGISNESVIVVGNRKELIFAKGTEKPLVWQYDEDDKRLMFGSETTIVHSKEGVKNEKKPYSCLKNNTVVIIDVRDGTLVAQELPVKVKTYSSWSRDTVLYDRDNYYTWTGNMTTYTSGDGVVYYNGRPWNAKKGRWENPNQWGGDLCD
jgi:glucosamine 6-phosphate synthetase-like amidotransferase/phosphosugar isomerase protein